MQATVVDQLGPQSFLVQLHGGETWRRHIDHLRAGSDQPPPPDTPVVPETPRSEEEFPLLPSSNAASQTGETRGVSLPSENTSSSTTPANVSSQVNDPSA